MKTNFWPEKQNQQLNLLRFKYIFESKDQALEYTPVYFQVLIGEWYEYIIDLYGNLFTAFENPKAARIAWKITLSNSVNRHKLKVSLNDINLEELLRSSSTSNSTSNLEATNSNEGNGYLYNDQVNNTSVNGKKYKVQGNEGNSMASNTATSTSTASATSYNLNKVAQFLAINSNADTDIVNYLVNCLAASIQPLKEDWGLSIETE